MSTAVSHDILITVRSRFNASLSDTKTGRYLFDYRIAIANRGRETVRLLRRHWIIRDSLAPLREVAGPGVIGKKPVLAPGEVFSYNSMCDLRSGFGRMEGSYLMVRLRDGHRFEVVIPPFELHYPWSSN